MTEYFPLGLAAGGAFCNRQTERQRLLANFANQRQTLIISPRRYGKTSLTLQAIAEADLPHTEIDFFMSTDAEMVKEFILQGVGELIASIISKPQQILKVAKEFLSNMHIKLDIGKFGLSVSLNAVDHSPTEAVLEALQAIEQIAANYNKKVVIFMDEFQQVGSIADAVTLEAAIRHVAQRAKHTVYVFSGSNRHLLSNMFDDSQRPLYMLCDRMTIARIKAEDYVGYIQQAALERWQQPVSDDVIDAIFHCSERHPYYLNVLCSRLWFLEKPPLQADVATHWLAYTKEETSRAAKDFENLSVNQRKVLMNLALERETAEPTSAAFLQQLGLSSASVLQALKVLLAKDLIYQNDAGCYCVLDPVIATIIRNALVRAT